MSDQDNIKDAGSREDLGTKNYGDLLTTNKGISMKEILTDGGIAVSKLEATSNQMFEVVDLPSKGWTYPENSVLASGRVKIKIPTGRNQAILSSQNLIRKGIMIDEFLKSLILENYKLQDLLTGDKNYLIFASRRMTYGNKYEVKVECPKCNHESDTTFDLAVITPKETPELFNYPREQDEFEFEMPISKKQVKFRLNNGHTENLMDKRMKTNKYPDLQILIRTACLIKEIDGKTQFVDILNELQDISAKDTFALRSHIQTLSPDINIRRTHECPNCYREQEVTIPITVDFFWPSNKQSVL